MRKGIYNEDEYRLYTERDEEALDSFCQTADSIRNLTHEIHRQEGRWQSCDRYCEQLKARLRVVGVESAMLLPERQQELMIKLAKDKPTKDKNDGKSNG